MEDFCISKTLGVTPAQLGVFLLRNKSVFVCVFFLIFFIWQVIERLTFPTKQHFQKYTNNIL